MDLCQAQIRIPANSEYSSLNLASAVQIITYELRVACWSDNVAEASSADAESERAGRTGAQERQLPATKQQRDGHIEHLQKTIESLDFSKIKPPTVLMRKLVRLYNKADLTVEEIQLLRGILSAVDAHLQSK